MAADRAALMRLFRCVPFAAFAALVVTSKTEGQAMGVMWTPWSKVTQVQAMGTGRIQVNLALGVFDCSSVGGSAHSDFLMHTYNFPTEGQTTEEGVDRMYAMLLSAMAASRDVKLLLGPSTETPGVCSVARVVVQ